ncbi:MAG: hypothetical protein NVSMB64_03410 [Candidatus Velthaea sp.]
MARNAFRNVNEYIASQPKAVQSILERVRSTIPKAVPGAEEVLAYEILRIGYTVPASSRSLRERSTTRSIPPTSASSQSSGRTRAIRSAKAPCRTHEVTRVAADPAVDAETALSGGWGLRA